VNALPSLLAEERKVELCVHSNLGTSGPAKRHEKGRRGGSEKAALPSLLAKQCQVEQGMQPSLLPMALAAGALFLQIF